MKTSNYISISYLILLFGGIIALFSAAKLNPKAGSEIRIFNEAKVLGRFSVAVAEPGVHLIITHDSISRILGPSHKEGTICKFPPYELRNDTLFFLSYLKSDFNTIQVWCNGIKSFHLKENAEVTLDGFQGDSLMVKLERATFNCDFNNFSNGRENNFVLTVVSKESLIYLRRPNVKKLNVELDHSIMRTYDIIIDTLSGNLKNKSWLGNFDSRKVKKENLEVDATSTSNIPK